MFFLLSFLWFIRETKTILFWIYLWQLKEYHLGRFLDHFRTEKGKKLFLNPSFVFKIILFFYVIFLSFYPKLLAWQFYAVWITVLTIFYLLESGKFFLDFLQKKLKKPILTQKTLTLISVSLMFEILFLFVLFQKIKTIYWFSFSLLSFDVFTPFLVSGIILFLQPLTVLLRNQIIKKAKEKRGKFKNLIVVGITGSYGKTSTKEFLATILSEKFKVLKTKEHQNSEVGISQCILNDLTPEHEIFVVEMGAYNRGGIKLLCDIAKPKVGIITGINEQHLATFGSQENIIRAKFELIENLPENGTAIFNGNSKHCLELFEKTKIPRKLSGKKSTIVDFLPGYNFDIWAENIVVENEFISFKIFSVNEDFADFRVNLLGAKNVENILLAVAGARELGMSLDEISKACQKIEPWQGGMQLKKGINGLNIIDATYSANPDGVISHLDYLKIWRNKKIIIMPCLIELGSVSKKIHKKIGQEIAEVCGLAIITTKDRFKEIKEGAIEKGMKENNILFLENPKEIFERIKNFSQSEDMILLEGRVPANLINLLIT